MNAAFERLAEHRMRQAVARGDLDDLPGKGEPLELDDMSLVPEELRGMYRLMKTLGLLPEEMQVGKQLEELEAQLLAAESEERKAGLKKEITELTLRFNVMMERRKLMFARASSSS